VPEGGERPRVAVLDDFQAAAEGLADWGRVDAAEVRFFHDHVTNEDALVERLQPYSVLVAMRERTPFPASILRRLPRLRLLVTTGKRNASIDLAAAEEAGVVVCGTRGLSNGTVEQTWALILGAARNLAAEDALIRSGGWQGELGTLLAGKTLGLVGLGKIGAAVARIATAFELKTVAWSPHLTPDRAAEHGTAYLAKDELFATSDIVSVHLVLGPGTRGVVGEAELRAMKPSAILVNTARGPIVDEVALLRAVTEGWIAKAALDVFDEEPLGPASPWRTAPNTLLAPHLGYVSDDNFRVFYGDAVEDIVTFLAGSPTRQIHPATPTDAPARKRR
jgi:phosphoglycerate dehydrogenase-like enzyme